MMLTDTCEYRHRAPICFDQVNTALPMLGSSSKLPAPFVYIIQAYMKPFLYNKLLVCTT